MTSAPSGRRPRRSGNLRRSRRARCGRCAAPGRTCWTRSASRHRHRGWHSAARSGRRRVRGSRWFPDHSGPRRAGPGRWRPPPAGPGCGPRPRGRRRGSGPVSGRRRSWREPAPPCAAVRAGRHLTGPATAPVTPAPGEPLRTRAPTPDAADRPPAGLAPDRA